MAQNLQQIKNVGKASAADIKQFAMAGIDIYGLLADSMGTTTEKVKDMDITYEQLADALNKASQEGGKYYGAMEKQGQTLNGQMSATKTSIQQLLGAITKSAMPIINKVLTLVQNVVNWLSSLDEGTQQTILIIAGVVAALGPVLIIGGNIIKMIGVITTAIGAVVGVLGGPLTIGLAAVIAIVVSLIKHWDTAKKTFNDFVTWIKRDVTDLAQRFTDKMNAIWESVRDTFSKITNWISEKLSWITSLFKQSDWQLPSVDVGDDRFVLNARPSLAAGTTNINMTVNGAGISANEVAGIVVDRLTTTIKRNNQRW